MPKAFTRKQYKLWNSRLDNNRPNKLSRFFIYQLLQIKWFLTFLNHTRKSDFLGFSLFWNTDNHIQI